MNVFSFFKIFVTFFTFLNVFYCVNLFLRPWFKARLRKWIVPCLVCFVERRHHSGTWSVGPITHSTVAALRLLLLLWCCSAHLFFIIRRNFFSPALPLYSTMLRGIATITNYDARNVTLFALGCVAAGWTAADPRPLSTPPHFRRVLQIHTTSLPR